MNHAVGVAVVDSFEKLLHILGGLLLPEDLVFLVNYFVEQRDSIDEFHHYSKIKGAEIPKPTFAARVMMSRDYK